MQFTWDRAKAASNLKKHGVSFPEATTVFCDPHATYLPDAVHSDRLNVVGYSDRQRILFVVACEVAPATASAEPTLRIISARRATAAERTEYEQ